MVQNIYFHCAPLRLGAGSIIEAGNWGRIKREFDNNLIFGYREAAFEFGRQVFAPQAPSRLNCVFCCETEEGAREYMATNAIASVLHQVQLVDAVSPIFRTSWDWIGPVNSQPDTTLQSLERDIQRYWQGNPDRDVEVLIGGAVRVVRSL